MKGRGGREEGEEGRKKDGGEVSEKYCISIGGGRL